MWQPSARAHLWEAGAGARRREGPAWWRMGTTPSVDFTREAPCRPVKAGEQGGGLQGDWSRA